MRLSYQSPQESDRSPLFIGLLVKMKTNGVSHYTIRNTDKALSHLARHSNLQNPESVQAYISQKQVSEGYKRILCIAYKKFAKFTNIQWEMPKYQENAKAIKIPTKEKVEMLIAKAKSPLSIKLQISAETGFRPVEVLGLRVKDIDPEKRLLYPTTAKHGKAKIGKMSIKLTEILTEYVHKHKLNTNDKLFNGTPDGYGESYREMRNQLAAKLHDPSIKTIRLYDLRHYYATMEYAKTRDILHVMQQMGHKQIKTTLIYTQLLNLNEDEWTCKTAKTVEEATQLIEAGFEYIQDIDGIKLYRKRK
jgi:integrase